MAILGLHLITLGLHLPSNWNLLFQLNNPQPLQSFRPTVHCYSGTSFYYARPGRDDARVTRPVIGCLAGERALNQ